MSVVLFFSLSLLLCIGAIAEYGSYTEGTWPVYIRDLNCTGAEINIKNCPQNGILEYDCNEYSDASVKCQGIQSFISFYIHCIDLCCT